MIKEFLFGSTVALCVAGQASALTLTLLEDDRLIEAEAFAGEDSDFDSDAPDFPFAQFASEVSASAMEFGDIFEITNGGGGRPDFGATSFGTASQKSQVTATTIEVSGSAFAEGSHGEVPFSTEVDSAGGGGGIFGLGSFEASASSVLDILFSIDEAAEFDVQAFISAGTEIAIGEDGNDVKNFAYMSLHNEDSGESVFKYEVSDDSIDIDESGVIGPGTYRFSAGALAAVFGGFFDEFDSAGGAVIQLPPTNGYQTLSRFGGIGLKLIAADQPIPEPVTTSLIAMGLGALVLRTSRRRRA